MSLRLQSGHQAVGEAQSPGPEQTKVADSKQSWFTEKWPGLCLLRAFYEGLCEVSVVTLGKITLSF